MPNFFTLCSNCSAAKSGNCRATDAMPTNRSGWAEQTSASRVFWRSTSMVAMSRSAAYQKTGLMLRAERQFPIHP